MPPHLLLHTLRHAACIKEVLETQYFPKLDNISIDGESYEKPVAWPWYVIICVYIPSYNKFHQYGVTESSDRLELTELRAKP